MLSLDTMLGNNERARARVDTILEIESGTLREQAGCSKVAELDFGVLQRSENCSGGRLVELEDGEDGRFFRRGRRRRRT